LALLRCLYDLALRRAEVVGLDLEDLDLAAGTLAVLGKGRTEKSSVTLPGPTKAALEAWLAIRGPTPGPLFRSLDRARKGNGRLTGGAVYLMVRKLGRKAGLETRPHGLRHAAITEALDLTGDVRAVQKFSRHRDVRTLERYDDARQDLAGEVAKKVAEEIGYPEPRSSGMLPLAASIFASISPRRSAKIYHRRLRTLSRTGGNACDSRTRAPLLRRPVHQSTAALADRRAGRLRAQLGRAVSRRGGAGGALTGAAVTGADQVVHPPLLLRRSKPSRYLGYEAE